MTESARERRRVLWWSRSGREYSRNRVIRSSFRSLGWNVVDYSASFNPLGHIEARLRRLPRPDLVWVPCFRQREVASAARWARRMQVPVAFDPLISAWDKQVLEREKLPESSLRAQRLLRWEAGLLNQCDVIIADTASHAEFFASQFAVAKSRLKVIPVSAEESVFQPQPEVTPRDRLQVLFYGSFIGLQGPEVIAEAARIVPDADWTLIGDGPLQRSCADIVSDSSHVQLEGWVPYESLPQRIASADIVLGVFGQSAKAARVIPNKVYQALACGRGVITRQSPAYPQSLAADDSGNSGLIWVPGGDVHALAVAVEQLRDDKTKCRQLGTAAADTYARYFSNAAVRQKLAEVLQYVDTLTASDTAD